MGRTVRRNALSVNVGSLDEKYFNFMQFKGLCTNKNYVGIDQNTFDEVNNMYVDQDDQLSTRPPVKASNLLHSSDKLVDMFKVNNIVFYNVIDGSGYSLQFVYHGSMWVVDSSENVKVMWFDDKYIVFTDNDLTGFSWNYETNSMNWFAKEDLIYLPITSIVNGTQIEENESPNILTNGFITRYLFNSTQATNTDGLIGKNITIDIDEDTHFIVNPFVKNNERVFVKRAGNITADIVLVDPTFGRIVAYNNDDTFLLFSVDANNFYTIPYPTATCKAPIISDDGDMLYIADTDALKFYYMDISSIADSGINSIGAMVWSVVEYDAPVQKVNAPVDTVNDSNIFNNTEIVNIKPTSTILPFGHSPEKGAALMYISVTGDIKRYYNSSTSWSNADTWNKVENLNTPMLLMIHMYTTSSGVTVKTYLETGVVPTWNMTGKDLSGFTIAANKAISKVRYIRSSSWDYAIINSPLLGYTNYNPSSPSTFRTPDVIIQFRNNAPVYDIEPVYYGSDGYTNAFYSPIYRIGILENYGDGEPIIINPSEYYMSSYYNYDMMGSKQGDLFTFKLFEKNGYKSFNISGSHYNGHEDSYYVFSYNFSSNPDTAMEQQAIRESAPYSPDLSKTLYTDIDVDLTYAKMAVGPNVLGNNYLHYADDNIPLLQNSDNFTFNYRPVYVDNNNIIYYDISTKYLWTSNYEGTISADVITWPTDDEGNELPHYKLFTPNLVYNFVSNVISINNTMYWSSKRDGKVYFPEIDNNSFEDDITAFVTFSQTSLGVFLEDSVYEFQYDSSKDAYLLTPTKLVLGNKKGADVLLSYDGSNIFVTTLKGLSALNYQDFVQSTEQTYSYLTENIMTEYDEFNTSPIKLYQYKDWLFMYKQDSTTMLILDIRTSSWWMWNLKYPITKIVFDGVDLLVIQNQKLEYFDFNDKTVFDDGVHPFSWNFESQKLHFDAPNNYKHIRSLTVITTESETSLRYKLNFVNYRNLNNLSETDTVEYQIDALGSLIKRVNFIKTNAFQFRISNDPTDDKPKAFVTSDVALKYRITERVR